MGCLSDRIQSKSTGPYRSTGTPRTCCGSSPCLVCGPMSRRGIPRTLFGSSRSTDTGLPLLSPAAGGAAADWKPGQQLPSSCSDYPPWTSVARHMTSRCCPAQTQACTAQRRTRRRPRARSGGCSNPWPPACKDRDRRRPAWLSAGGKATGMSVTSCRCLPITTRSGTHRARFTETSDRS